MIILNIETSTNVCSVALGIDGDCVFQKSNSDGLNHATMLSPFIEEALQFTKTINKKLDAVAVSSGPGSYTGLRIGVSTVKGLCYGLDIPLIAIDTLQVMAVMALQNNNQISDSDLLCPMIDARRMEVYSAIYNNKLELTREIEAEIINEESFTEIPESSKIYFFGNGAAKCTGTITHSNAVFLENIVPLAENMTQLSETKFKKSEFVDVAYFEPFYLKEFQVTTPKNK